MRGEHGEHGEQGAAHGEGGLDHDAQQGLVGHPVDDGHRLPGTGDPLGSLDAGDLHGHGKDHLEDALGSYGRHQPAAGSQLCAGSPGGRVGDVFRHEGSN